MCHNATWIFGGWHEIMNQESDWAISFRVGLTIISSILLPVAGIMVDVISQIEKRNPTTLPLDPGTRPRVACYWVNGKGFGHSRQRGGRWR